MPLSMRKKLDMREMKPINVSLQLVDRSVKHPIGLLEDVPMRVLCVGCLYHNGHR